MGMSKSTSPIDVSYFARTTAGTEEIAWLDISQRLSSARLIAIDWRRVEFKYDGLPGRLLALRSVDDIYVFVGRLYHLDQSRLSLQKITRQIPFLSLSTAVQVCEQVRIIPNRPNYAVTASLLGGRNYSRYEVAAAIRDGLQSHCNWTYVEHGAKGQAPDIDLRVLIEGNNEGIVGLRLGQHPLHRRPYKIKHLPGSLKPPVAYCMSLLAGIRPSSIVLDPMCGAGTIPVEAAKAFDVGGVWALDINTEAILCAIRNAEEAKADVRFLIGDATRLPLPDSCVDRIVCNLPWGKQLHTSRTLRKTYAAAIPEFSRVLRERGRAVLLTERTGLLLKYAETLPGLRVALAKQISLFGSHPTICIMVKSTDPLDWLHPFQDTDALDQGLNELARTFIVDNLSHPSFRIRKHALEACVQLRDPDTVLRLHELLDDDDGRIRRAASNALDQWKSHS